MFTYIPRPRAAHREGEADDPLEVRLQDREDLGVLRALRQDEEEHVHLALRDLLDRELQTGSSLRPYLQINPYLKFSLIYQEE